MPAEDDQLRDLLAREAAHHEADVRRSGCLYATFVIFGVLLTLFALLTWQFAGMCVAIGIQVVLWVAVLLVRRRARKSKRGSTAGP